MTIIDQTTRTRFTAKQMKAATEGLGPWCLKSGSEFKHGVYFPESDTFLKVDAKFHRSLVEFCRGWLTQVPYTPQDVWEWGA